MTAMPPERRAWREVPPTAGLPLALADVLGRDDNFEDAAARWLEVDRLRLFCSGTAALVVTLAALARRQPGRKVVVAPAYTCPLVAIAVARAGLTLRLCDLAPESLDLDHRALDAACGGDTLAVLPTHLGGRVADVAGAAAIARAAGAFVVEDAAQAFGARADGQPVGAHGDAGFYSLAVGKGLTLYEGGLLWVRDPALGREIEGAAADLIRPAPATELWRSGQLVAYALLYRPAALRLAYGRPLRAALARGDVEDAIGDRFGASPPLHTVGRFRRRVGTAAIGRLDAFQAACAARATRRAAVLRQLPGVSIFGDREGHAGTWPYLLALLPDERTRDAKLRLLWTKGLGVTRLFAHALPDYRYLAPLVPRTDAPNARALAARTLTITNSPDLRASDFDAICDVLSACE